MIGFGSVSFAKKTGVDPKGGISRLAKVRKPQCTGVHEDFRIERNAENTLLGHPILDKITSPERMQTSAEPRSWHRIR